MQHNKQCHIKILLNSFRTAKQHWLICMNHILLKSSCRHKPSKSNLVEPQQMLRKRKAEATEPLGDWPGEKRWQHKQPTGHILPWSTVLSITTTNPSSYVSYQISPKRQCRQCHSEFPHRKQVIPYNIVLSHEERWMYPNPQKTSEKLPAAKFTKKFYCAKSICVASRFPYFDSTYLEIPTKVREALKDAHMKLIQVELRHSEKWCGVFVKKKERKSKMALSALNRIPLLNIKEIKWHLI